jgi:hypothetical protein
VHAPTHPNLLFSQTFAKSPDLTLRLIFPGLGTFN